MHNNSPTSIDSKILRDQTSITPPTYLTPKKNKRLNGQGNLSFLIQHNNQADTSNPCTKKLEYSLLDDNAHINKVCFMLVLKA